MGDHDSYSDRVGGHGGPWIEGTRSLPQGTARRLSGDHLTANQHGAAPRRERRPLRLPTSAPYVRRYPARTRRFVAHRPDRVFGPVANGATKMRPRCTAVRVVIAQRRVPGANALT